MPGTPTERPPQKEAPQSEYEKLKNRAREAAEKIIAQIPTVSRGDVFLNDAEVHQRKMEVVARRGNVLAAAFEAENETDPVKQAELKQIANTALDLLEGRTKSESGRTLEEDVKDAVEKVRAKHFGPTASSAETQSLSREARPAPVVAAPTAETVSPQSEPPLPPAEDARDVPPERIAEPIMPPEPARVVSVDAAPGADQPTPPAQSFGRTGEFKEDLNRARVVSVQTPEEAQAESSREAAAVQVAGPQEPVLPVTPRSGMDSSEEERREPTFTRQEEESVPQEAAPLSTLDEAVIPLDSRVEFKDATKSEKTNLLRRLISRMGRGNPTPKIPEHMVGSVALPPGETPVVLEEVSPAPIPVSASEIPGSSTPPSIEDLKRQVEEDERKRDAAEVPSEKSSESFEKLQNHLQTRNRFFDNKFTQLGVAAIKNTWNEAKAFVVDDTAAVWSAAVFAAKNPTEALKATGRGAKYAYEFLIGRNRQQDESVMGSYLRAYHSLAPRHKAAIAIALSGLSGFALASGVAGGTSTALVSGSISAAQRIFAATATGYMATRKARETLPSYKELTAPNFSSDPNVIRSRDKLLEQYRNALKTGVKAAAWHLGFTSLGVGASFAAGAWLGHMLDHTDKISPSAKYDPTVFGEEAGAKPAVSALSRAAETAPSSSTREYDPTVFGEEPLEKPIARVTDVPHTSAATPEAPSASTQSAATAEVSGEAPDNTPSPTRGGGVASSSAEVQPSAPAGAEAAVATKNMPEVKIGKGGFEGSVQRLYTELQGKGLKAEDFPPKSDMHRLLSADEKSIGKVAHQIVLENHKNDSNLFVNGKEKILSANARLSIDPSTGRIDVVDASKISAPAEVAQPSGVRAPTEAAERSGVPADPTHDPITQKIRLRELEIKQAAEAWKQQYALEHPESVPQAGTPEPLAVSPDLRVSAPSPETIQVASNAEAAVPIEYRVPFRNPFNVDIDPGKGDVFTDAQGSVIAFGNEYEARLDAAQKYAQEHPGTTVWVQAHERAYDPVGKEWRSYVIPVRYSYIGGMKIDLPFGGLPNDPAQIGTVDPKLFTKKLS